MKNPKVSVIVCTKDRAKILEKYALSSLFKQNYPNYEIIVVDDASKDNTLQMLEKYKRKLKIVKNNRSRGLCFARNLGIKNAKGEIIAFMDDDCVADKNWIKELVSPYLEDSDIMVVGGKVLVKNSKKRHINQKRIYGGNMSFRREIFKRFLFDANLQFNKCSWYDETELLYRLKKNSIKMRYLEEKAIVRHFKMPAEYRKNSEFGGPMNRVYMDAKDISLVVYYTLLLFVFIKFQKEYYKSKNHKEIIDAFRAAKGLFSSKNLGPLKLLWIFYTLFFILPIKVKIQNAKEERMLNS